MSRGHCGGFHVANQYCCLVVVLVLIVLVPRMLSHAAPPSEGSSAPDFTLPSQEGSSVSLKDYRGKWVVLYFYPKDQTAGCSREAHDFQVDQPKYGERNAVVLGVSLDSMDSHKKFCAKEEFLATSSRFPDSEHKVTDSYGSLTNFRGLKFARALHVPDRSIRRQESRKKYVHQRRSVQAQRSSPGGSGSAANSRRPRSSRFL